MKIKLKLPRWVKGWRQNEDGGVSGSRGVAELEMGDKTCWKCKGREDREAEEVRDGIQSAQLWAETLLCQGSTYRPQQHARNS